VCVCVFYTYVDLKLKTITYHYVLYFSETVKALHFELFAESVNAFLIDKPSRSNEILIHTYTYYITVMSSILYFE